jgi:hypothetical protein
MGKRGPRRQDGKRETNGRLSRRAADIMKKLATNLDFEEREALRPGVEARHRLFGIPPADCRDQMGGSFVGRLALAGELTDRQYEAAKAYLESYLAMAAAAGSPRQPGAVNLNATKGLPGPENVERSRRAMQEWEAATKAVQTRQNEIRRLGALIAALRSCVIEDQQLPHMVPWLIYGLDALADHYRIGDRRKDAAAITRAAVGA